MARPMHPHLFEHPLSSYAQKVKIALREKNVPFTREIPDSFGTDRRDDAFAAASPRHEVPALAVDGATIFDSTIILEFIEERWPDPPLLPADPLARARARTVEEVCDTQYEAVNWGWGEVLWFNRADGDLADRLRDAARAQTRVLQSWLAAQLGEAPWFNGDRFGWADAAAAAVVNRSVHYGLAPADGTPLARWHARLRERPAVAETFAEFDAAAARMEAAADIYRSGRRRREYRDHRLDWMVRSGGLSVVRDGMEANNIRFSWPSGAEA